MDSYEWRPYVSVAERRRKAAREMAKLAKKGHPVSPVVIEGRTIARPSGARPGARTSSATATIANRLPRGRTYVRNGSVVDLQIAPGEVKAQVSGSELYQVDDDDRAGGQGALEGASARDCAGAIDSLVELLQGRFSKGVMETHLPAGDGPVPLARGDRVRLCSCPDWAVDVQARRGGALRRGRAPRRRARAALPAAQGRREGTARPRGPGDPAAGQAGRRRPRRCWRGDDLADLFGLEMAAVTPAPAPKDL